jgi:hypothetical protein
MNTDSQMNDISASKDFEANKLPSFLNVLTILTYVGCGLAAISAIYNHFNICETVEKLTSKEMPEVGGMLGSMVDSALELSIKQCDNRLVILVSTLATTLICFFGAFLMRQLKKQGFIIYIIGELIGPASMMVILGMSSMGVMMIFGLIINILFVILYATQRRFLVN